MTSDRKTSRWATGIAMGAVAVLVVTALALVFVRRSQPYQVGQLVDLPPALYQSDARTLILFARNSCSACQDAKPFLTELIAAFNKSADGKALLLSEDGIVEERVYAAEIGIAEAQVRTMDLRGLRVRSVPTVLLVNARGTVLFVGEGVPSSTDQPHWFAAIQSPDQSR